MPEAQTPPFTRVVIALSGGSSDARIVKLVSALASAKGGNVELIAVHVVEIDWTLPLDADVAGQSEEAQRVLDQARIRGRSG